MSPRGRYARYRAPGGSGEKLIVPPLAEWSALSAEASSWRAASSIEIAGRSLASWADAARREVLERAAAYVATYAEVPSGLRNVDPARPLFVAGHQPELVHPGVWLKNFVLAQAAHEKGGAALNLVIDADLCRRTAISVPSGSAEAPHVAAVEFDVPSAAVPWEEREVRDADVWRTFPERVAEAGGRLLDHPLLIEWWPSAVARTEATGRIGLGFAQARHLAELRAGSETLELPQSELCRTTAFRQFAVHLLHHLPRLTAAYNESLADYRRAHKIRNHAHPTPNLGTVDGWQEAPFWLWTGADPRRRPLFARCDGTRLQVTDRRGLSRALPCSGNLEAAFAELAAWEADGVKLRSRALTTTMFARLALADLFVHGIGGAKYDEATDAICERFFGSAAPAFAVVSGTLRLPIDRPPASDAAEARILAARLRELDYHPERLLAEAGARIEPKSAAADAIAEKARWLATPKTPENAAERHRGIVGANGRLRHETLSLRERWHAELVATAERNRAKRILASREYAFCLFPRAFLSNFMLDSRGSMA